MTIFYLALQVRILREQLNATPRASTCLEDYPEILDLPCICCMSSLIQLSLDLVGFNGGNLQARVHGLSRVLYVE